MDTRTTRTTVTTAGHTTDNFFIKKIRKKMEKNESRLPTNEHQLHP